MSKSKGGLIGIFAVIILVMYVLFGVDDPIDIYDGLVGILRKLADKGKWVKMLWKTAVEGDFLEAIKLAWDGIMDTFGIGVKNNLPDWLLPDWFKEVK